MKQPSLFYFSPGLFDDLRRDYARQEDLKVKSKDQIIEHLNNRITGYKGVITKLKKQL